MGDDRTAAGSEKRRERTRKIVLIDLENMLFGDHHAHDGSLDISTETILALAEARRPTDHLIVGCNPQLAFQARELFPAASIVTGRGKDGADRALLESLDLGHAAERFDELCIVSGDHAFTGLARKSRLEGMAVRVVAPHAGLSTALRLQANLSIFVPRETAALNLGGPETARAA